MLQVSLQGLQAGELLREVYGSHSWMGAIPVQLLLQHPVDLIEGAQQDLPETSGSGFKKSVEAERSIRGICLLKFTLY